MGSTNEILLATPPHREAFSITQSEAQWLTTAFLMANGLMIVISAFLIDGFTTRDLFLTAMRSTIMALITFVLAMFLSSLKEE